METVTHAISWFEIAVLDFERARRFYCAIFDYDMPQMQMGPNLMGFLPHVQGTGIGGAIVRGAGRAPSRSGALVYLNGGADLAKVLARVIDAGGAILQSKTEVAPGMGYYAELLDSEGNRIGLHSAG